MAWFSDKISLGGFPDLSGAVNKFQESVKNIEKNAKFVFFFDNRCEEDGGEEEVERGIEMDETEINFLQSADIADEACSFTTNEGGDSSSTVSNTSPVYSSGSIFMSWQKGGLLGKGSFGSVYEGISGDGDFFAVKEVSLLEQGSQAEECIQQLEGKLHYLASFSIRISCDIVAQPKEEEQIVNQPIQIALCLGCRRSRSCRTRNSMRSWRMKREQFEICCSMLIEKREQFESSCSMLKKKMILRFEFSNV